MADELDLLQEQDELLNQLHILAARQRSCLEGKSRNWCECCGNRIPPQAAAGHPGRTYLYGMPAGSGNTTKTVSEVTDGKKKNQCDGRGENR